MKKLFLGLVLLISINVNAEVILDGESLVLQNPLLKEKSDEMLELITGCNKLFVVTKLYRVPSDIELDENDKVTKTNEPFYEIWGVSGCNRTSFYLIEITIVGIDKTSIGITRLKHYSERST